MLILWSCHKVGLSISLSGLINLLQTSLHTWGPNIPAGHVELKLIHVKI